MSSSAAWLVLEFSLLSKFALIGLLPTSAIPLLGWVPLSHACNAEVMSIRMYWLVLAEVSGAALVIVLPNAGEDLAVMVVSDQALLTRSTLKLPAVVTPFT
jgi:hypothetical protein